MSAQETAVYVAALRDGLLNDCRRAPKQLADVSMTTASAISGLASRISKSQIVIWESEVFELATNGHDVFRGLGSKNAADVYDPPEPQFWDFNRFDITLPSDYYPLETHDCGGLLFIPRGYMGEPFAMIVFILYPKAGANGNLILRLVNLSHPVLHGFSAQIYACLAFMQLKIAAREKVNLPRHVRRRLERNNEPVPEVRVIQLRQRESSGEKLDGSREYHYKWIVQGHWRRLPKPRKEDGALVTFIHAYVKGPDSAPLLQPRESIYVVAR